MKPLAEPRPLYHPEAINPGREREGYYASEDSDGFNGRFVLRINGLALCIIASDGRDEGVHWEHVSVSIVESTMPPSWQIMCKVKELFWGPEEWVIQFHPAEVDYINNHPGVLHLWRWTKGKFPLPDKSLV